MDGPQHDFRSMKPNAIKNLLLSATLASCVMLMLTGCVGLSIGGGTKTRTNRPTVGQQLIDLQRAKDSGAITEPEYEAQKAKLLEQQ